MGDDSTWDDSGPDYSGSDLTASAVGMPTDYSAGGILPGDVSDQQQMGPWSPPAAQAQGVPWWAGTVMYGVTRAIDNAFPGSPTGIMGNTYPGSGASAYGRTYTQRPTGIGGGTAAARASLSLGGNPLLLLGLGLALVLVLK